MVFTTTFGSFLGNEKENAFEFLGIPFAKANRFEYATIIENYPQNVDATKNGPACMQIRNYYPHLEHPERHFYFREFRENIEFQYSEDCLNLNIWTPKEKGIYPVVIWIHGGGFDSGANSESNVNGEEYAKRGVVFVAIQYRVGIFGYLTNKTLNEKNHRGGNFGLDDQYKSILWVKDHISEFYGDPNNITLMGQSAGAISIQYLSISKKCEGLFQHAVMVSGGGLFPKFSLPRPCDSTCSYWDEIMELCHVSTIEELKSVDTKTIFDAIEIQKSRRKDNTYHTMPVIDGYLLDKPVDELIKTPLKIDYMLGFTNNDMYAYLMAKIALKYGKQTGAYLYYFDMDAKGDSCHAFHSSDCRYLTGTLSTSWRPYEREDYELSTKMIDYLCNFARSGNPNGDGLPIWTNETGKAIRFSSKPIQMIKPNLLKPLYNMLFSKLK